MRILDIFRRKPKSSALIEKVGALEIAMSDDKFNSLLSRMDRSSIASVSELVGCSADEISVLESKYGIRLPSNYRRYLELMGHKSGRLFTCDHAAVFYEYVLNTTADFHSGLYELEPPSSFVLPADAFFINCRLGDYFEFIRCNEADESSVHCFNSWDWNIIESDPSVVNWLESWCAMAENAIATGYYESHPNGTTP